MTTEKTTPSRAKGASRTKHERVPALCNDCGNQRDAAWVTIAREKRLKCSHCRRSTMHALVLPPGWDYTEDDNAKSETAEKLLEHIRFIESMGVAVVQQQSVEGGTVEILRYEKPVPIKGYGGQKFTHCIVVRDDLHPQKKIEMLRWAWKNLLPCDPWDGPTLRTAAGNPFKGIHRKPEGSL